MINSNVNSSLGGLKFGTDGEGNYGYFGADGSLIPFSNGLSNVKEFAYARTTSGYTRTLTLENAYSTLPKNYIFACYDTLIVCFSGNIIYKVSKIDGGANTTLSVNGKTLTVNTPKFGGSYAMYFVVFE